MVRTQIQLEAAQAETLKRVARERHISMAEAVRQAVDAYVAANATDERAAKRERALAAIGAFSGGARLSQEHDDAFAEEETVG